MSDDTKNPLTELLKGSDTKATDILAGLAKGEFGGVERVIKFVKEGHKLDNFAMVNLLTILKDDYDFDNGQLLQLYLILDKAVEDGVLGNDLIEYMRENSILADDGNAGR